VPLWLHVDDPFRQVVAVAVLVAVAYAASRRVLPRIARRLVTEVLPGRVPPALLARLPERYVDGARRDDTETNV
jgi:hypothetical protein